MATIVENGDSVTISEPTRRERIAETGVDADAAMRAEDWKLQGNEYYKAKDFPNALECYEAAVAVCLSINKDDVARSKRDVYYCNLAACLQQMGRDQEAVDACSQAIEASPKYIKAYMRRGQTLEKMEKFQDAINDMTSVLEIEPGNDLARKRKVRLERFEEQRMEKLKTETMDKLKDLGNSFLSNFGMSTDNFKFEQDPSTGSYNVQFVQNPGGEESSSSS